MKKDFDTWNENKKKLHEVSENKLYHERELWWCALGANIGSEQDGSGVGYERPVLILKGMSRSTCFIVPLSASSRQHKLRVALGFVDGKRAVALLSQIRLIDTKRLINKIGFLDKETFQGIRKAAKDML